MNFPKLRKMQLNLLLLFGLILLTNITIHAQAQPRLTHNSNKASLVIEKAGSGEIEGVITRLNRSDKPCSCSDCKPEVRPCPTCCPDNRMFTFTANRPFKGELTPGVYNIEFYKGELKVGSFRGIVLKSGEKVRIATIGHNSDLERSKSQVPLGAKIKEVKTNECPN